MDLLLWRHAEAVDGVPDNTRELTERGIKQAHKVAEWLEKRRPKKLRVLVSPTTRTRQTASAFTQNFEIVPALAPGNDISSILGAFAYAQVNADFLRRREGRAPILAAITVLTTGVGSMLALHTVWVVMDTAMALITVALSLWFWRKRFLDRV